LPEPWGPGAHWAWPLGIDRLTRVRVDQIRQLEFGRIETPGPLDEPGAGESMTGDLNIVRTQGVVQYRVADPIAYSTRSEDVERLLAKVIEASLSRALASRDIDAPLRSGRPEVALDVQQTMARSIEALDLGVIILGVSLTDSRPPTEVEPAFAEAQAALSERERLINEARSLARKLRPAAQASAETSINDATAKADRDVALARAQAQRFLSLLAEADRSRTLTVRQIYRDALRDLLPKVRRKVLMTPEEPVDLGLIGSGTK
jgi:membrane protease subunit HflK